MNDIINSCMMGLNSAGRVFCDYAASMFVQSSVLIILLLIIDLLLRKRVRATLRYCVWMLVFIKLVLPPTLCLPTGIGYWCGDYLSADSAVFRPVSNTIKLESPETRTPQDFVLPIETSGPRPSRVLPETVAPAVSAVSSAEPITWQAALLLVWLAGVLIISILLLQRIRFVRWLITQSSSVNGQLLDLLNECRRQLGIRRNIGLRLSSNTASPAVCGLFKPIILMPTSLVKDLSPDKLRAVFIHELAHIKRGDLWVNLAQTLLQIIYFYNPFVWLANAVVRRIREQAVDEMVLVSLGPQAKSYSNTLIDIAEMAFWRTSFSLRLIGVVESKKALRRRIKHMLTRPMPKSAKIGVFGLLCVIVMAAVLLPMAAATAENEEESEPRFMATLPNGVTVELAGVSEHPSKGNKWWRADGTTIEDDSRPYAFKELRILRLPSNQQENKILELAVKITDSSEGNVGIICSGANRTFINCRDNVWGGTVEVGKEPGVKDFEIGVAAGAWETLASSGSRFGGRRRRSPGIVFTEAYNTQEGYAIVIVTHNKDIQKENWRVVAIDKEGELHNAELYQTQGIGEFEQDMFHFKRLKSDQIRRFEFQTRPYDWVTVRNVSLRPGVKTDVQVEIEPILEKEQAADLVNYAWQRTDRYVPPKPEEFFPDDPEGGKSLDGLFDAVDKDRRPDGEVLSTVRQGFRRTSKHRTLILAWIGNKYIWNKQPQNPEAVEIMYHAVPMERHYAVYFGLSVLQPKTPNVLRTLAEICMQGEDVGRITWGARSQQDALVSYIKPYLEHENEEKREMASTLLKHFRGEIDFEKWKREKFLEQKKVEFGDRLPELRDKLLTGNSQARREVLTLIQRNVIGSLLDDSFLDAMNACAEDKDPAVRRRVASIAGNRWVWSGEENDRAIQLMLKLSEDEDRDTRYKAVYHGLSTVRNKNETVVRRLVELALADHENNLYGRIVWGLSGPMRADKELLERILAEQLDEEKSDTTRSTSLHHKAAIYLLYRDVLKTEPPRDWGLEEVKEHYPEDVFMVYFSAEESFPSTPLRTGQPKSADELWEEFSKNLPDSIDVQRLPNINPRKQNVIFFKVRGEKASDAVKKIIENNTNLRFGQVAPFPLQMQLFFEERQGQIEV